MLYRDNQIKELYDLKHRNDNLAHENYDYENNLLKKTLSPYLFHNPITNGFLDKYRKLMVLMFDQMNIARNFKNYIVDKYWHKHID